MSLPELVYCFWLQSYRARNLSKKQQQNIISIWTLFSGSSSNGLVKMLSRVPFLLWHSWRHAVREMQARVDKVCEEVRSRRSFLAREVRSSTTRSATTTVRVLHIYIAEINPKILKYKLTLSSSASGCKSRCLLIASVSLSASKSQQLKP